MYQSVRSLHDDLTAYYGGQMSAHELYDQWVTTAPDVSLIDAGARRSFAQAHEQGTAVDGPLEQLWNATASQMEMVYRSFYEDVGMAKDTLRAEGIEATLEKCFPSI
ncbi:MAG: hypothetical protein ACRD0M_03865 [Acidimicrobiales bacterium]